MTNPVLTPNQSDRIFLKHQLERAENAREGFRREGNWQRYSEMCEELARLGGLLRLCSEQAEQEKH